MSAFSSFLSELMPTVETRTENRTPKYNWSYSFERKDYVYEDETLDTMISTVRDFKGAMDLTDIARKSSWRR